MIGDKYHSNSWRPIRTAPVDGQFLTFGGFIRVDGKLRRVRGPFKVERINSVFFIHESEPDVGGRILWDPTDWAPLPDQEN